MPIAAHMACRWRVNRSLEARVPYSWPEIVRLLVNVISVFAIGLAPYLFVHFFTFYLGIFLFLFVIPIQILVAIRNAIVASQR